MPAIPPTFRTAPAASTVTVARYLATRLHQLGVDHLFGLPGDFNLSLLDEMLAVPGVRWVGRTNELNAAYADDGYARVRRGVAAVVTTAGVGELSTLNGIAGSYADDVPVVHVAGLPPSRARADGHLLHHTLLDGDHDRFLRAAREVTAAAHVLGVDDPALQIDDALRTALDHSEPVYLGVPTDVALALVPAAALRRPVHRSPAGPGAAHALRDALTPVLAQHTSLTVLAGAQIHRRASEGRLQELAGLPGVRIATQVSAKGVLDESHPASVGTYIGAMTPDRATRDAVDAAPLLALAGTVHSDVLTGLFSHRYPARDSIELSLDQVRVGHDAACTLPLDDALAVLCQAVEDRAFPPLPPPPPRAVPDTSGAGAGPLSHAHLWSEMGRWMPSDVTLIADVGTALWGALELQLPNGVQLLAQPIWSSIGYTLPATLGASLAAPERRPVLLIGDGAAQLTIGELATLLHGRHTPIVVLLNNSGYTIERAIRSPEALYHDIMPWDWTALPSALAPTVPVTAMRVTNGAELGDALRLAGRQTDRLVLIEALLVPSDAPRLVKELGRRAHRPTAATDHTPVSHLEGLPCVSESTFPSSAPAST